MCTEFFLAFVYFLTIVFVNYFLFKLLKSYLGNIFYLLKLRTIFTSFKKSTNNLVFLLSSFSKKEKKNSTVLTNLSRFSNTTDLLIIGNTYKYLGNVLQNENVNNANLYYFELLANQYLANLNNIK